MIKTFRGKLEDGEQRKIRLSTNKGVIGYRITKFRLFPIKPGQENVENTVQVWRYEQDSVSTSAVTVNFDDPNLLGVATFHEAHADLVINEDYVVFDSDTFNQDIFVTHTDTGGALAVNYYLELEQFALSNNEASIATLTDMRAGD